LFSLKNNNRFHSLLITIIISGIIGCDKVRIYLILEGENAFISMAFCWIVGESGRMMGVINIRSDSGKGKRDGK